jgi:hypothetical protein
MWLFKSFDKKRTQNLLKLSIERMTLLQNKKKALPRHPTAHTNRTNPSGQSLPRLPPDPYHDVHPRRVVGFPPGESHPTTRLSRGEALTDPTKTQLSNP